MPRFTLLTIVLLFSYASHATDHSKKMYQIDLIIFTHQHNTQNTIGSSSASGLALNTQNAIPLHEFVNHTAAPFSLLSTNRSHLNQEYWILNRKPDYQVLAHYTWLQPSNNQKAIVLPSTTRSNWIIEGTMRVRQSNYYLLDTSLRFSTANNTNNTFLFSQSQRLKAHTVYYLDHPKAGMLIKVHQVA